MKPMRIPENRRIDRPLMNFIDRHYTPKMIRTKNANKGPSIKYVTLQRECVTVCDRGRGGGVKIM